MSSWLLSDSQTRATEVCTSICVRLLNLELEDPFAKGIRVIGNENEIRGSVALLGLLSGHATGTQSTILSFVESEQS